MRDLGIKAEKRSLEMSIERWAKMANRSRKIHFLQFYFKPQSYETFTCNSRVVSHFPEGFDVLANLLRKLKKLRRTITLVDSF